MKKLVAHKVVGFLIAALMCLACLHLAHGQSQGISYQAIIIDKNAKELPGIDIQGNYLPNNPLDVRFTILNQAGDISYQEVHHTSTDDYGMINLIIGQGQTTAQSPSIFSEMDWDGTPRDLKVEISIGENTNNFTDLSFQQLTFVPYAFHRNITATGTLTVDGKSALNNDAEIQRLTVRETTALLGDVRVENGSLTTLTGDLTVSQATNLQGNLTVGQATTLQGDLNVSQATTLQGNVTVNSPAALNGQVTIRADVNGNEDNYNSYPLRVEGSNQGMAIKIDGSRNASTNFVTFMDDSGIQGRIEGQTIEELVMDPQYIFDNTLLLAQEGMAIANQVAAGTSTTGCFGLGACETIPIPSLIISAAANLAVQTAQVIGYNVFRTNSIGVTYQSSGADYAEWLPKENQKDKFYPGDVVGIRKGMVSKQTDGAEYIMVISQLPAVLGNIPAAGEEHGYEKIAFMGQVPVKVIGSVNAGDYILPSGFNNGFGIAKHPDDMQLSDYRKIVGIAWASASGASFHLVNVSVGLNTNDLTNVISKQQLKIDKLTDEISKLKSQIQHSNNILAQLVPGYREAMEKQSGNNDIAPKALAANVTHALQPADTLRKVFIGSKKDQQVKYYEITDAQIDEGIELARKTLQSRGIDLQKSPFFAKLHTDPTYKQQVVTKMKQSIRRQISGNIAIDEQP